ncbi:MAG: hypothetical protein EOP52_04505 [Sphingobacteriales bacterium]|nr:MAG: hypothetical protein EOP52_04505 [Sphingobacteriales bacterium]
MFHALLLPFLYRSGMASVKTFVYTLHFFFKPLSYSLFTTLIGLLFLTACAAPSPPPSQALTASDSAAHREWKPANLKLISNAIPLLQTGDIVLRTGADATSHALMLMNQKSRVYSHCGIVSIESGTPWIYHSTGGEENPDAHLLRETPAQFFDPSFNEGGGVYRYLVTPAQQAALSKISQQWYREGRTFDMEFDLATDTQLYCAEFVYKAFRKTGFSEQQFSKSKTGGFEYIGIDDLYSNRDAKMICSFRYQ